MPTEVTNALIVFFTVQRGLAAGLGAGIVRFLRRGAGMADAVFSRGLVFFDPRALLLRPAEVDDFAHLVILPGAVYSRNGQTM